MAIATSTIMAFGFHQFLHTSTHSAAPCDLPLFQAVWFCCHCSNSRNFYQRLSQFPADLILSNC